MRKVVKKQLIEMLGTIEEGIKYAASKSAGKEQKNNILVDCYSAFSHIKNVLENSLSEDEFLPYRNCIDEIQENMEILNEHIQMGADYSEILDALNNNMKFFDDLINSLKVKLDVLFIPYKSCVWDALESIWSAAKNDENCNAIVMPIPYYDKNPDGSFGKMYYEGDLFPSYVPITDYRKYNIEQKRPDIVYYSNPYDDYNLVTSVAPAYYTKQLRKSADMLVYIPYFILDEINPNNEEALENISHFILTLGVINADKVIVQSEDMRQAYINVLTKSTNVKNRKYWENKVLGLGSPKVDKIMNTKKEDLKIPDSWLEIIKKPDGSYKKIVLYNISISALLTNSDKVIEKLKYVFSVFKENRDDVALLWRPHPLYKTTIKSMRSQLEKDYDRLVDEYKKENWGIYDDTPDFDTAMILSDAYYGDRSSLVNLYKLTKKPILIQDFDLVSM